MELLEEYEYIYAKVLEGEDKDKINKPYKISGNIFAQVIRDNIMKILKDRYEYSVVNSYIRGCNIEWDLLILKKGTITRENYNIYSPEQVVCALEFKTSGLIYKKEEEKEKIKNYLSKYIGTINKLNEAKNTNIKYGYISLCEKEDNLKFMRKEVPDNCFWIYEGRYQGNGVKINKRQDLEQFIKNLIKI